MLDIDLIAELPSRPKMYHVSKVWESVWPEGQEAIHSWLGSKAVTYLSLHPMPLPPGYRSKVESCNFAHLCPRGNGGGVGSAPCDVMQRGQCILFSVVFTHSQSYHQDCVCVLPLISLLFTNTVSPVRACLITWWERFRGTHTGDDRGIQYSLGVLRVWENTVFWLI